MLPTQLKKILDHLNSENNLNKNQKRLLHELNFINDNTVIQKELQNYTYTGTILESFSAAFGSCPNCGKVY